MTKTITSLAGALLFAIAFPAAAEDYFDGSHTLLCTIAAIFECSVGSGCSRVTAEEVDAPNYFLVDFNQKILVTTRAHDERRESAIENMETVDDKLIVQGIEDGRDDVPNDGVGWSMAVNDDDGGMVISAVTDGAALTGLGWCVPRD